MQSFRVKFTGIQPLLLNNPQMVDSFNSYAKAAKAITSKRAKTEEDLLNLRKIEVEAKLYFDENIGLWIPATWVSAAIAGVSFKRAKISKADIRASVFQLENKLKLTYAGMENVTSKVDIVNNETFHNLMNLKQGQVRVCKVAPIFHDWSFETVVEFDETIVDGNTLKDLLKYVGKYGGFGDFRPTYGRAEVEFFDV